MLEQKNGWKSVILQYFSWNETRLLHINSTHTRDLLNCFSKESSLYLPNDICSGWHMKSEQNTKQSLSCLVEKYNLASNKRKYEDKIWTWHTKYGTTQTVRTNLSAKSLLLLCSVIFCYLSDLVKIGIFHFIVSSTLFISAGIKWQTTLIL